MVGNVGPTCSRQRPWRSALTRARFRSRHRRGLVCCSNRCPDDSCAEPRKRTGSNAKGRQVSLAPPSDAKKWSYKSVAFHWPGHGPARPSQLTLTPVVQPLSWLPRLPQNPTLSCRRSSENVIPWSCATSCLTGLLSALGCLCCPRNLHLRRLLRRDRPARVATIPVTLAGLVTASSYQ